ncbi:MAG: hypothetical protein KJ049_02405 [Gammaproteobacteria bacterium]|nr:hypothetical protein [uncultured bacterium]MCL4779015.1 hypothetical protein [Gammaproteobacteria bacterium]
MQKNQWQCCKGCDEKAPANQDHGRKTLLKQNFPRNEAGPHQKVETTIEMKKPSLEDTGDG